MANKIWIVAVDCPLRQVDADDPRLNWTQISNENVMFTPRRNSNRCHYVSWGSTAQVACDRANVWINKEIAELQKTIDRLEGHKIKVTK